MAYRNIHTKYEKEPWFQEITEYFDIRYKSVENRMIDTFEYVTPDSSNRLSHSFNYSRILRDVGSIVDSTLSAIILKDNTGHQENIFGFLALLETFDENMKKVSVDLRINNRTLYPFKKNIETGVMEWWHSYNKVKHSEVVNFNEGNFENALNSVAALKILHLALIGNNNSNLFFNIGQYKNPENASVMFDE